MRAPESSSHHYIDNLAHVLTRFVPIWIVTPTWKNLSSSWLIIVTTTLISLFRHLQQSIRSFTYRWAITYKYIKILWFCKQICTEQTSLINWIIWIVKFHSINLVTLANHCKLNQVYSIINIQYQFSPQYIPNSRTILPFEPLLLISSTSKHSNSSSYIIRQINKSSS